MGKKRIVKGFLFLWIVFSVLFSYFSVQQSAHKIQNVNMAMFQDGYLYGIDMAADQYYLFCVNVETEEQKFFTQPIMNENSMISLKDMVLGVDGSLYVHYQQLPTDGSDTKEESIAYCDFEAGKLVPRWKLQEEIEGPYFQYWCKGDGQLVLETFDTTNGIFQQFDLQADGTATAFSRIQMQQEVYMIASNENGIWTISQNGDISRVEADGRIQKIFSNDGTKISTQNTYYTFSDDYLHFYNVDAGQNYKVSMVDANQQIEPCYEHTTPTAKSFDISKVTNVMEGENAYVGILALDDGRNVPVVYGEKEYLLDQLTEPMGQVIGKTVLAVLICTAVLFFYVALFYGLFQRNGGAPVLGLVVLLMIPVLAFGMVWLFTAMDAKMPDEKEQKIQQLTVVNGIIKQKVSPKAVEELRQEEVNTFLEANQWFFLLNQLEPVKNLNTGTEEWINQSIGANLYYEREGELFPISLRHQLNLSMEYQATASFYEAMQEAAQKGHIVYLEYSDYFGRYLSVFSPIKNEAGEIIGVLETNENILSLEHSILSNNQAIKELFFAAGVLIFVLIFLVFWINTRALKTLRQAMVAMAAGALSARAHIKGNHEVAVIAKQFDQMAQMIENRVTEMEDFQNQYEAFVPSKPFSLLRKDGIQGVRAGDAKDFFATVLTIHTQMPLEQQIDRGGWERNANTKEGFLASNESLARQLPVIHAHGGVVDKLFLFGATGIFTREVQKNVVECAIALLEQEKEDERSYFVGISEEELRFGVIGLPKRKVTAMIAEHGSLSAFLQQLAAKWDTPILITGRAASRVDDFFTSYHTRVIGYLSMTASGRLEILYEVLNGDSQKRQRLKLDTKEELETGIGLFMSGDLSHARRRFIHVLQQDPTDGVAREYVLLCEKMMGQENKSLWLEEF